MDTFAQKNTFWKIQKSSIFTDVNKFLSIYL